MAKRIKKLPFPRWLAVTPFSAEIKGADVNPDGEQETVKINSGMCIFDESSHREITKDGKKIVSNALVMIEGDVAPSLSDVSSGRVTVNGCTYEIAKGSRPRNPDGTVHHTEFEVI